MVMQLLQEEMPALLALFSCGIVGWFILGWANRHRASYLSSGTENQCEVFEDDVDQSEAAVAAASVVERTMLQKNKVSAARRRAKQRQQAAKVVPSAVVSSETVEFNSEEEKQPMLEQDNQPEIGHDSDSEQQDMQGWSCQKSRKRNRGVIKSHMQGTYVEKACAVDEVEEVPASEEVASFTCVEDKSAATSDTTGGLHDEAEAAPPLSLEDALFPYGDDEDEWDSNSAALPWGQQTEQSNSLVAAADGWMGSFEAMLSGPSFDDNMQVSGGSASFGGMQTVSPYGGGSFTDGSQVYEPMVAEDGQQFYTDGQGMLYAVTCVKIDEAEPCNDSCCNFPSPTMDQPSFSYMSPCDASYKHRNMEEEENAEWNASMYMNQAFTDGSSQVYEDSGSGGYFPAHAMDQQSFSYMSACDASCKHRNMEEEEEAEWNACWDFKPEPRANWR